MLRTERHVVSSTLRKRSEELNQITFYSIVFHSFCLFVSEIFLFKLLLWAIPIACFHSSKGPPVYETATLRPTRHKNLELELESNLFRCMSDASLVKRRRGRGKSEAQREQERQHRFSINRHFYNYKVCSRLTKLSEILGPFVYICLRLSAKWWPVMFCRPQYSPQRLVRQLKFAYLARWQQTKS